MKKGSTLRSSGVEIVAPAGCQGPPFFLRPTPTRSGGDSAAYTPSTATTLSCTICQRRGGQASKRPVEAAGPVDAQTDARPQGPWTPANGRRRPQLPQAPAPGGLRQQRRRTPLRLSHPSAILTTAHSQWP